MELKYMEIPTYERQPKYVEWYDMLDEFWESGEPSALIEGVTDNRSLMSIRNAIKHRYPCRVSVVTRKGKIYLRRDVERAGEELIG